MSSGVSDCECITQELEGAVSHSGTGGYFMSYCALDEAHSKNKEEQIFMVFASVVKGLK